MATLRQVREAIADALSSEFGNSWNVEPRPPDSVVGRTLIVAGFEWTDQTFEGGRQSMVDLYAVVSRKHTSFIDELDEVLDPDETTSIPSAIDADPTLGAVVDSCRVESAGDYRSIEIAGVDFYGATVRLEVFH